MRADKSHCEENDSVAQLVERLVYTQDVAGSNPVGVTLKRPFNRRRAGHGSFASSIRNDLRWSLTEETPDYTYTALGMPRAARWNSGSRVAPRETGGRGTSTRGFESRRWKFLMPQVSAA